jgi:ferredoxin
MAEQALADPSPEYFSPVDASEVFLRVGGLLASVSTVTEAYEILEEAPGLMVRQPLAHYKNPLARCDYHAEAAPYREQYYLKLKHQGLRGASAPPTTKYAFMHALQARSQAAMSMAPLVRAMPLVAEAYAAMAQDFSYVAAMSQMATSILGKQHAWRLRSELRQAQGEAMIECSGHEFVCEAQSACGTGDCKFAQGIYTQLASIAQPGKTPRPANHAVGGAFSSDSSLAELEKLVPFRVTH